MRDLRVKAGLSIGQLARLMNTSVSTVSAWERGEDSMNEVEAQEVAGHLGVTVEELLSGLPTTEEANARRIRVEAVMSALTAAKADAKAKGFGSGSAGQSSIPCPACKTGTLRYRVASVNGHMWAACTTPDCARWME